MKILIDKENLYLLKDYAWSSANGYARCDRGGKKIYLHRLIMGNPVGKTIDHINHNKLDNRRINLRICSKSDNNKNTSLSRLNKSGYKGVSWDKTANAWRLRFIVNKKNIVSRVFANKILAAREYNKYALQHFREFANLNKI